MKTPQDLALELIAITRFGTVGFNGKQIAADLRKNRRYWYAALPGAATGTELQGLVTGENVAIQLLILALKPNAARMASIAKSWELYDLIVEGYPAAPWFDGFELDPSQPWLAIVARWD